jgi:hypothetical protein
MVTRLWAGLPGDHGLVGCLPGTRDFSLLQSIQTVPTVHRGAMDTGAALHRSTVVPARGLRLIVRTAVTAHFTLASSGLQHNYKGKSSMEKIIH